MLGSLRGKVKGQIESGWNSAGNGSHQNQRHDDEDGLGPDGGRMDVKWKETKPAKENNAIRELSALWPSERTGILGVPHSHSHYDYTSKIRPIPTSRSFVGCPSESTSPIGTMQNFQRLSPTIVMTPIDQPTSSGRGLPRSKTTTMSTATSSSHSSPCRETAFLSGQWTSLPASITQFRLSPVQKQSLQNTWRIIKDNNAERLTERIFQKMITNHPKVKDVFYKAAFLTIFTKSNSMTTYRDHTRLLVRLLNDFISNLDKCEIVLQNVRECGMKHVFLRQSEFKADIWEKFGEAAIEVISEQDCVKSNLEAGKAWTMLIASITDEMRHGFEKEARRRSYSAERPKSAWE